MCVSLKMEDIAVCFYTSTKIQLRGKKLTVQERKGINVGILAEAKPSRSEDTGSKA